MFTHFLSGLELDQKGALKLLDLAQKIKANPVDFSQALAGKSVVTLFEKPSLRTRLSFDIGINKLGGHAVYSRGIKLMIILGKFGGVFS